MKIPKIVPSADILACFCRYFLSIRFRFSFESPMPDYLLWTSLYPVVIPYASNSRFWHRFYDPGDAGGVNVEYAHVADVNTRTASIYSWHIGPLIASVTCMEFSIGHVF